MTVLTINDKKIKKEKRKKILKTPFDLWYTYLNFSYKYIKVRSNALHVRI